MKYFFQISVVLFSLITFASVVFAGNFEDGLEAADLGDFKKAHQLWLLEAERGNTNAQYRLGLLYGNGQGVPGDYKEAVKWFRLAAE